MRAEPMMLTRQTAWALKARGMRPCAGDPGSPQLSGVLGKPQPDYRHTLISNGQVAPA